MRPPGKGGEVDTTLAVTGGSTLYVEVGGTNGGFNGGGSASGDNGGGGGSDLRTVPCGSGCPGTPGSATLGSRLVVGGGGGGWGSCNATGGDGGAQQPNGNGDGAGSCGYGTQAGGGTQDAGGAPGVADPENCASAHPATPGVEGSGGSSAGVGSGGGGGYYGGGADCAGGAGGGGSSYGPSGSTFSTTSAAAEVEITPVASSSLAASATSVTSSANPSVSGQQVTFTATVAAMTGPGLPSGSVEFKAEGADVPGCSSVALQAVSGAEQATCSTSALSVAGSPHAITAVYGGDGNFSGGSATLTGGQTVNPSASQTSVSSDTNPSAFGQQTTFTATVAAAAPGSGAPAGTVEFKADGSDISGCEAVSLTTVSGAQQATCSTSGLSVAGSPHAITAIYGGGTDFASSNGTLSGGQTVGQTTQTDVSSSVNPSVFSQGVTLTATVSTVAPGAGAPVGSVEFEADGTDLTGCAAVSLAAVSGAQQASCSTTDLAVTGSPHAITAIYSGGGNFGSSTATLTGGQTVNRAATSVSTPSSNTNPSIVGGAVTFSATVSNSEQSSSAPLNGGTVTFSEGDSALCTSAAVTSSGSASCSTSSLSQGAHQISASYSGDDSFAPSGPSSTLTQQVATPPNTTPPPAPRVVAVIATAPGRAGLTYRFSAAGSQVSGGKITGYRWTLGGRQIGTGPVISYTFPRVGQTSRITITITDSAGQTTVRTITFTPHARATVARLTVHFALDRGDLQPADRHALAGLRVLFAHATSVSIVGYCAAHEAHRSALLTELSVQRARSVLALLTAHHNHRPTALTITGHGASHFLATNRTAHGRAQNRRVTVTIHYLRPTPATS